MIRFNRKYFFATIILLIIEILIAFFVHDSFIRPYIGDLLVVILIYCLIRTFLNTSVFSTAIGVLVFSYLIEALQYFQLVKLLGLQHSKLANIVIGNYFAWADIIAYTIGVTIVLIAEQKISAQINK